MAGVLRVAREEDAPGLLGIYAPYVEQTVVSFEYTAPTVEEFARRIRETLARHPYLVWEEEGRPLGYAYAHPYAARPAYQWSAELTVYLRQDARGKGLGSRLYGALFDVLRLQGVRTVYGCVTAENQASVAMHHALGFQEAGRFHQVGFKQGRWLDVLWLEREIAPHRESPQPLIPFPQLDRAQVDRVLRAWEEGAKGKGPLEDENPLPEMP